MSITFVLFFALSLWLWQQNCEMAKVAKSHKRITKKNCKTLFSYQIVYVFFLLIFKIKNEQNLGVKNEFSVWI